MKIWVGHSLGRIASTEEERQFQGIRVYAFDRVRRNARAKRSRAWLSRWREFLRRADRYHRISHYPSSFQLGGVTFSGGKRPAGSFNAFVITLKFRGTMRVRLDGTKKGEHASTRRAFPLWISRAVWPSLRAQQNGSYGGDTHTLVPHVRWCRCWLEPVICLCVPRQAGGTMIYAAIVSRPTPPPPLHLSPFSCAPLR